MLLARCDHLLKIMNPWDLSPSVSREVDNIKLFYSFRKKILERYVAVFVGGFGEAKHLSFYESENQVRNDIKTIGDPNIHEVLVYDLDEAWGRDLLGEGLECSGFNLRVFSDS